MKAASGTKRAFSQGNEESGYSDFDDASQSQWYNACVSGSASNTFPYGDSYEEAPCNGYDQGVAATVVVGSLADCQSTVIGYAGIVDLSGNVWEWEDSCDSQGGSSDHCHLRGGSFFHDDTYLRCAHVNYERRDYYNVSVGLRCCAP